MSIQLPPCPANLKPIQHYLKTALEHDGRDPVISYWCRMYALQTAMKIDKRSDEAKLVLIGLMDWLEAEKKKFHNNEAITNDIAAQAHIENYALKLFFWADGQDRSGQFNKNVVKAFYTAGFLMDVLVTFGEQTEEIQQNCKYAKWKAAYIHNCLKNGEAPIPGPAADESSPGVSASGHSQPNIGFEGIDKPNLLTPSSFDNLVTGPESSVQYPIPPTTSHSINYPQPPSAATSTTSQPTPSAITPTPSAITPTPSTPMPYYQPADTYSSTSLNSNGIKLLPDQISKAQKYCKWAGSALNYDDVPEAVSNLQKALKLLTTGEDI